MERLTNWASRDMLQSVEQLEWCVELYGKDNVPSKDKEMKRVIVMIGFAVIFLPMIVAADESYEVTGHSGGLFFVAIDPLSRNSEDVYRLAVGEACAGRRICQVAFWVGSAPSRLPLTDSEVVEELVRWQLNLNTGLRRWLVKCDSSGLFENQRECM